MSHVLITSGRPLTPPAALTCLTRSSAAARAGPSNGAIAPFESYAQPIVIGEPAFLACVRAAAVVARPIAATATRTSARRARVNPFIPSPLRARLMPQPSVPASTERSFPLPDARARQDRRPRASPGTPCRRRRCPRRFPGRSSRPTRRRRGRRESRRRSRAPWPGSARSAQPRVGSRQSFTCTPAKRWMCVSMWSRRSGVFQRCHTSNWMPSAGLPTSSISSTASGIVLIRDQLSIPSRWNGSSAMRMPARSASARDRAQAVDDRGARVVGVAIAGRAGEADDRGRAERGEPVDRCADGVDPLLRVVRAGEQRQRQDGRDGGDRGGGAEAAARRAARGPRRRARRGASSPRCRSRRGRPRRRRGRRRRSSR